MKYIIYIFLTLSTIGCDQKQEKIEGKWNYFRTIKNGKELQIPRIEKGRKEQIKYSEDGEMIYLSNNKRYGIGYYYYHVIDDSLYISNIQYDSLNKVDTISNGRFKFSISQDTMILYSNGKLVYYKKDN